MATIYDGARVFDATDGNDALAAKMNELQDKLILGLEARTIAVPIQLAYHDPAEATWRYIETDVANPPYWDLPGVAAGEMLTLPIPYVPSDTYITEVNVVVDGNAGAGLGGAIGLWEQPIDDTPTATGLVAAVTAAANPWSIGGVVTLYTSGAIAITTNAKSAYSIVFTAHTGAAGAIRVYGAFYVAQFHAGV